MSMPNNPIQRVTVVDVDVSFSNLVFLMIKLVLASIPATLILLMMSSLFGALFVGLFGALG